MSVPYPDTQPSRGEVNRPSQDPYGALAEEIALRTAQRYGLPADQDEFELAMMHAALDAVTEALHRARTAGLLLPEGAETRTRWAGTDAYIRWWIDRGDDAELPEPVASLVDHVVALQERIDRLPDHDRCTCWGHRCACSYDRAEDVCMTHTDHVTAAVRLAVGDSKPSVQDPSVSVEETPR